MRFLISVRVLTRVARCLRRLLQDLRRFLVTKLNGFLDHFRGNLEVLDEQIENARAMSKAEKGTDSRTALQWTKTLRDLIELRNATMEKIKGHILGRDETGAINEPSNVWDHNDQVEFERHFKNQLSPWTEEDLKLECEDCGVESEEVSNRHFSHPYPEEDENLDLCEKCYNKKTSESTVEDQDTDEIPEPASKRDISVILQTAAL